MCLVRVGLWASDNVTAPVTVTAALSPTKSLSYGNDGRVLLSEADVVADLVADLVVDLVVVDLVVVDLVVVDLVLGRLQEGKVAVAQNPSG